MGLFDVFRANISFLCIVRVGRGSHCAPDVIKILTNLPWKLFQGIGYSFFSVRIGQVYSDGFLCVFGEWRISADFITPDRRFKFDANGKRRKRMNFVSSISICIRVYLSVCVRIYGCSADAISKRACRFANRLKRISEEIFFRI